MLPLNISILVCYFLRIFKIQFHYNQILDPLLYMWGWGAGGGVVNYDLNSDTYLPLGII